MRALASEIRSKKDNTGWSADTFFPCASAPTMARGIERSAARPTLAQYSTCAVIERFESLAALRAMRTRSSESLTGIPMRYLCECAW